RVLEQPRVAHLVTLNADGSPQVTTVWVGLDGDEISVPTLPSTRRFAISATIAASPSLSRPRGGPTAPTTSSSGTAGRGWPRGVRAGLPAVSRHRSEGLSRSPPR